MDYKTTQEQYDATQLMFDNLLEIYRDLPIEMNHIARKLQIEIQRLVDLRVAIRNTQLKELTNEL